MSELDVLVVGGGISGLSIAHSLTRSGLDVEVWESAARAGGKIKTSIQDGYRLDRAASMVMNFRSELDPFLDSAGLGAHKRIRKADCKRYVFDAGVLCEAPSSVSGLLKTPLFSAGAKLRLLAEPLVPRSRDKHESVAQFVTRRLGREFMDKVFDPYVAGPLASDVNYAEALSTMPRLVALEKRFGSLALGVLVRKLCAHGSAARPQAFSFTGGLQTLVDTLAGQGGFGVHNNLTVKELWPVKGGWMAKALGHDGPHSIFARQVILSTPAYAAAALLAGLDTRLASLLQSIEYAPVKVVHTGFRRSAIRHPLNGSGFLTPRNSGFAVNGCLWMSSLFPDHAPQDHVLLSSYLGGARNPAAGQWSAQRSLDEVIKMLRVLLGIQVAPQMLHIDSHARALPLYHGAYSQQLAAIDQRLEILPGLHLEANYRGGVSVRDRILCAQSVTTRVLQRRGNIPGSRKSFLMPAIKSTITPVSAVVR